LFGAGANYGSVDYCPKCPPPGNKLFLELLARGGLTARLTPELRRLFEKDFEKRIGKFIETQSIDIHVILREMSEYFVPFTPGPNNVYNKYRRSPIIPEGSRYESGALIGVSPNVHSIVDLLGLGLALFTEVSRSGVLRSSP